MCEISPRLLGVKYWWSLEVARVKLWTVDILHYGYHVPVQTLPPQTSQPMKYLSYTPGSNKTCAPWGELEKMLEKRTVETVHDQVPAFYSRLFLVEKATGGQRPMINLSPLNKHVDLSSSGWKQYPQSLLQ